MRTRAGLIATIAVGLWLSLAAGNNLAANQGSYKPTEADIERQQEMERLEKQMKETEKVLEKFRKQDEDFAKRVAQEDEARSTRKFWGRLISGGLFVVLTLGLQLFKRRGRHVLVSHGGLCRVVHRTWSGPDIRLERRPLFNHHPLGARVCFVGVSVG